MSMYEESLKEAEKKEREYKGKIVKRIILGVLGVIVLFFLILAFPFGTIGAGERGVRLQFGAVVGDVQEGLYVKVPFAQRVVRIDVKVQKDEVSADAASKDLQTVTSTVALNYHLDPSKVTTIYQEVGVNYNERIIAPAL